MLRNPYKEYLNNHVSSLEGRALESMVLQLMANKIMVIHDKWDTYSPVELYDVLKEVLERNMLLWNLFQTELKDPKNQNTVDVKSKMLSLSVFVIKSTYEIYINPDKSKVKLLAEINTNISLGLSKKI